MSYLPEPPFDHDRVPRVGVLLVNLGTPDEATPGAVRRYLAEFLSDPRVVEIPRALWLPILHGVILRVRPARSARKYAAIWGTDGSPLLAHGRKQRSLLQGYLPAQLSDSELDALIAAAIAQTGATSVKDMGKVMGIVKGQAAGKADMGTVGARIKARLGAG